MNVNVGKFFKKMFGRKQSAPTKVERKVAPQIEKQQSNEEKVTHGSEYFIRKHNALQYEKAKKRLKNRKKVRAQKANRKANRKGGKS